MLPEFQSLTVMPGVQHDTGTCACCGQKSRVVVGDIVDESSYPVCVYYVHWTLGRPDHGASFDLIVGNWGDDFTATDRVGISLLYRPDHNAFMVVDAATRPFSENDGLFSRSLPRDEVIGSPYASVAFRLVDEVWLHDSRIAELRVSAGG